MNRTVRAIGVGLLLCLSLCVSRMRGQQPVETEPQAPSGTPHSPREVVPGLPVPRLVKFAGTLNDEQGRPRTGVVGATFAVYKEQEGGAALWLETQNVQLDEQGHYTVLLGATKSEGLPLELFAAGEPRWLGVQVNGSQEKEQGRVLLVSVPYALKAADADTLGGKPVSSFVLTEGAGGSGGSRQGGAIVPQAIGGSGTQNVVAKFDATGTNVTNSSISDDGSRVTVGEGINFGSDFSFVGNADPARTGRVQLFDRANVGFVLRGLNLLVETLQGASFTPTEVMRWTQAGNVGIHTSAPTAPLEVAGNVKISGGGNALVFPDGSVMSSAATGVGGGTITGVMAGAGLGGGGTTGGVTLNVANGGITSAMLGANSVTNANIADGSLSPTKITGTVATLGANSFTDNQSVTGNLSLSGSVALPNTTSASVGAITLGGAPFMHNFGSSASGGNTFVGNLAGNTSPSLTGFSNSAFGSLALNAVTTGNYNSAFGGLALRVNTMGSFNTAIGYQAGLTGFSANANTTGSNNTFIGANSGPGIGTQLTNATAIGANALVNCPNCLVLGDSTMPMNVGIRTNTPAQALEIAGNIQVDTAGNGLIFPDGSKQTTAAGSLGGSNTFTGQDIFAAAPTGPGVGQGSLYIDPPAAGAGQTLLGAAVGGTQKMLLDSSGTLTLAGSLALPSTSSATVGVVSLGGFPFLHDFGTQNTFVGTAAGNTSPSLTGTANAGVGFGALNALTTGGGNVAFGFNALLLNTTASRNSSFGSQALQSNSTASDNSAAGFRALFSNTTGSSNSAFGSFALSTNTVGMWNAAFGVAALSANITGNANSAFGYLALANYNADINADANSAFGYEALQANTGPGNSAFGVNALLRNTTGASNSAFGFGALALNISGAQNAAFGYGALDANTASGNSAFGWAALNTNSTGARNSAFGNSALLANTTGGSNSAFGVSALGSNATACCNSAFGASALSANITGTENSAFGDGALTNNIVSANSAFGYTALLSNSTGTANSAFGDGALFQNTTGGQNAAFGVHALFQNTTGGQNAAFGGEALASNQTNSNNSAFGFNALFNNTADSNSAFGFNALSANTIGSFNAAFGAFALQNNNDSNNASNAQSNSAFGYDALTANTIGSFNAAFGTEALASNQMGSNNSAFGEGALFKNTGHDNSAFGLGALSNNNAGIGNTAVGAGALNGLVSGNSNIAIGFGAGSNLTGSESNNILIGDKGAPGASNVISIGNLLHTATLIFGIFGQAVDGATGTGVFVDSNGKLGTVVSSRRFKHQVADMGTESDVLMKLRPVGFYYKPELDKSQTRQYGLVAEEVAQVAPELVVFDKDGQPLTVRYHFVNAMLLNEVQRQRRLLAEQQTAEGEQRRMIEEQQSTVERQQAEIQELAARLAKLEALVMAKP